MSSPLKRLLSNEDGNFAVTLALTMVPIIMSTGAAIDYVGYKRQETKTMNAAEAALLSASKEVVRLRETDFTSDGEFNLTKDQILKKLDAEFKPFFEANYESLNGKLGDYTYELDYLAEKDTARVTISMPYDAAIMGELSGGKLDLVRTIDIKLNVEPKNYVIDIVMCIDATGSMQRTLDSVQAAAKTFNRDLRKELGIEEAAQTLKIRVRPMFFRDWEEGRDYQNKLAQYNRAMASYETLYKNYLKELKAWEKNKGGSGIPEYTKRWLRYYYSRSNRWYIKTRWGAWARSFRYGRTHKRIWYNRSYHYFRNSRELEAWMDSYRTAGPKPTEPTKPVKPEVNHGLNMYPDFLDLDPSTSDAKAEGKTQPQLRTQRNAALTGFLGSTRAFGGHDWPEGAGACFNEAIRSNWYDNQSDEAREYFGVPKNYKIIAEGETIPKESYTKITPIPVTVFWSDATINSLSLSRRYLSSTTPSSYPGLKSLWENSELVRQREKLFIRFGPESASGYNTIMNWDRTFYGGNLTVGNEEAVKVIARKILEVVPEMLRVGS